MVEYHDWMNAEILFDENVHWLECECGMTTEAEEHVGEDSCGCGYVKE
jgi:hypothetical protein